MSKGFMINKIGTPAMLEQFAEECCELGQAALKYARILRGENPTPVEEEEAKLNLISEYTDVIQCAEELGVECNFHQMSYKERRFNDRWNKMKG